MSYRLQVGRLSPGGGHRAPLEADRAALMTVDSSSKRTYRLLKIPGTMKEIFMGAFLGAEHYLRNLKPNTHAGFK
jgi:hypothetical protein